MHGIDLLVYIDFDNQEEFLRADNQMLIADLYKERIHVLSACYDLEFWIVDEGISRFDLGDFLVYEMKLFLSLLDLKGVTFERIIIYLWNLRQVKIVIFVELFIPHHKSICLRQVIIFAFIKTYILKLISNAWLIYQNRIYYNYQNL